MSNVTDYALTTGGWCIHGVAYGPLWACGQCGSSVPMTYTVGDGGGSGGTVTAVGAPGEFEDLFAALDRMTGRQLREFVRRFRSRYSVGS